MEWTPATMRGLLLNEQETHKIPRAWRPLRKKISEELIPGWNRSKQQIDLTNETRPHGLTHNTKQAQVLTQAYRCPFREETKFGERKASSSLRKVPRRVHPSTSSAFTDLQKDWGWCNDHASKNRNNKGPRDPSTQKSRTHSYRGGREARCIGIVGATTVFDLAN
jgi:hypothetical protein